MKRRSFLKGILATTTVSLASKAYTQQDKVKQALRREFLRGAEEGVTINLEPDNKPFLGKGNITIAFEGVTNPDGNLKQFAFTDVANAKQFS